MKYHKVNQQKIHFVILLLCLCYYQSFSQTQKKTLKEALADMNVTFKMPKDYIVIEDGFKSFECWDSRIWAGVQYTIIKKDSSVRIGFRFGKTSNSSLNKIKQTNSNLGIKGWGPEKIYWYNSRAEADTINDKIIYYSKRKSKKAYNAKHVAFYSRNCVVPYLGNYTHNKIVLATASNYRQVYLIYLYSEEAKPTISEEIKKTESMVRFKN